MNVLTPSIKNSESADKKDQYRTMNDAAVEGKTLGFSPDTSAISTELAALQNVKDQYRGLLEMGFYDVDTYLPEFRQALKDAGGHHRAPEAVRRMAENQVSRKLPDCTCFSDQKGVTAK